MIYIIVFFFGMLLFSISPMISSIVAWHVNPPEWRKHPMAYFHFGWIYIAFFTLYLILKYQLS